MSDVLFTYKHYDYSQRPAVPINFPITANNWLTVLIEIIRSGGRGSGPLVVSEFTLLMCPELFGTIAEEGQINRGLPYATSNWLHSYYAAMYSTNMFDWRTFEPEFITTLMNNAVETITEVHEHMICKMGASFCTNMHDLARIKYREAEASVAAARDSVSSEA